MPRGRPKRIAGVSEEPEATFEEGEEVFEEEDEEVEDGDDGIDDANLGVMGYSGASVLLECRIQGVTPLLMNRFSDEAQQQASSGQRGSSAAADRGSPREQAEATIYFNEAREIIIPQPNLFACFIEAGRFFKVGKRQISTKTSSILPAAMNVSDPYYPLEFEEPWRVDARPVRIPTTGGRIIRYRAAFDDWAVTFRAEVDTQEMNMTLIRSVIDAAGKKVGLCDFRVQNRGPFGKFVVTHWDVT